ncbi:hypothetical protein D3C78_1546210 [compost metagenome]
MRDGAGSSVRSKNRRIRVNGLTRNASHDMNAELQSQAVHIICKRLEALAIGCRREASSRRYEAGVGVHFQRHERPVLR